MPAPWRVACAAAILAVLSLLAVSGVSAEGESPESRPGYADGRRVRLPGDEGLPPGAHARIADERRRFREQTEGSDARRERAESRGAYRRLARAEALAVARRKHSDFFTTPVWSGLPLAAGEEVTRYIGRHAARIEHRSGKGAVAQSTIPLRTPDESGELAPTDLRLDDRGAVFEPRNPVVRTQIPKRPDAPVRVGAIGLTLAAEGEGAGGVVTEDKVFYNGVSPDVDALVAPTPLGVEVSSIVRSEDSGEELRLALSLPAGARIRSAAKTPEPGDLEIARGEEVLATVSAPNAWDAQRRGVPASYGIDGDDLVIRVPHRGGDWAYPILVDPTVSYWWGSNPMPDHAGWGNYFSCGPGWTGDRYCDWSVYSGAAYIGGEYLGHGLVVGGGGWYLTPFNWGKVAEWNYYTEFWRSSTAFVYRADIQTNFRPETNFNECAYAGVYSMNGGWEQGNSNQFPNTQWCWPDAQWRTVCVRNCEPDPPPDPPTGGAPNYFVYGTWVTDNSGGAVYRPQFTNVLRDAVIYVADRGPPYVAKGDGFPNGWIDTAQTFQVRALDTGLGVASASARTTNTAGWTPNWSSSCTAAQNNHCPSDVAFLSAPHNSTGQLNEGINAITVSVTDLGGWTVPGAAVGDIKIDKRAPTAQQQGSLYDQRADLDPNATYNLTVDATDGTPSLPQSGVKSVTLRLLRNGQEVAGRTETKLSPTCVGTNEGCSYQFSAPFSVNTAGLSGRYAVQIEVKDQLAAPPVASNHTLVSTPFEITVDRAAPAISVTHSPELTRWFTDGHQISSTVSATDAGTGVKTFKVTFPGGSPETRTRSCGGSSAPCLASDSERFDYTVGTGRFPGEGRTSATATVTDAAGRESAPSGWTVKVDRSAPVIETPTGGLYSANPTGRTLRVRATDGNEAIPRSGVKRMELWIDRNGNGNYDTGEREVDQEQTCPNDSCFMDLNYTLPADYPEGNHKAKVVVTDQVGMVADREWTFGVVNLIPSSRSKLGLEDFFQYDTTEAGGDSAVHVNAETGNLIWHSVPVVNPGRGLSTVVNLTYNSQDRGGLLGSTLGHVPLVDAGGLDLSQDLPGLSYGEAGVGFSIGISGPTRVNEPLGGVELAAKKEELKDALGAVAGQAAFLGYLRNTLHLNVDDGTPLGDAITLTDADGTVHAFQRDEGNRWKHPPGVAMHLRRYRATVGTRLTPVVDQWAMTRPDGVTHFFDSLGYLTSTKDRNGNTLRYDYENVNVLDGAPCPDGNPVAQLVTSGSTQVYCVRRLYRVVDPAGVDAAQPPASSTLRIAYKSGGLLSTGQLPFDSPVPFPALVGGRAGRIDTITDHKGRAYKFDYDGDGFLTTFTEVANPAAPTQPRVTKLVYEAKSTGSPSTTADDGVGQDRQLVDVIERVANADHAGTHAEYYTRNESPPTPGVFRTPRRAKSLVNRRGFDREYTYRALADGTRDLDVKAKLKHAEGQQPAETATTNHKVDDRGRPVSTIDALGRQTTLEWDGGLSPPDNRVTRLTEPGGAVTEMTYTANGLLETRTARLTPSESRTTSLDYRNSGGVHHAVGVPGVDDSAGQFVSDLIEIENPKAGTGWKFDYRNESGVQDNRGNPRHRTDGAGHQTTTEYDAKGQIVKETDEVGHVTRYGDHHETGQPRTVRDPLGASDAKRWIYRYDAAGNVTHVTDPRGDDGGPLTEPRATFTTSLHYDEFDRLTKEVVPKDSTDATPDFITRTRKYDRNGNVVESVDGELEQTVIAYTKMDQPETVQAPASGTTTYRYDGADRLIGRLDPVTSDAQASSTEFVLDRVGQRVAEIRHAHGLSPLVTSFAYDVRGNLVGLEDPKRNKGRSPAGAVVAAGDASTRRLSYAYNLVDEMTTKLERPTPAELAAGVKAARTEYEYDANGNRRLVRHPRTFADAPTGHSGPVQTLFEHDHRDQVAKVTDPDGKSRLYERREDGKVIAETSARGESSAVEPLLDPETGRTYDVPKHFSTHYLYDRLGEVSVRTIPYGPGQYELPEATLKNWHYRYTRDRVGNPTTIVDPRGNSITNTFFDTGHLKSTTRPSAYELDWGEGSEAGGRYDSPDPGERFGAQGDDVDTRIAEGGPRLAERMGRSANAERSGEVPELPSSDGQGNFGAVDRESPGDLLPRAGTTTFRYDDEMRLEDIADRTITYDAAGRVQKKSWPFKPDERIEHTYTYDAHGNLATFKDGAGAETTFRYDGFDRRREESAPGAASTDTGAASSETTTFDYDENGNLWTRNTPRPGHSFQYRYDGMDRLSTEANPRDEVWAYAYDAAGNRTMERSPEGAGRSGADARRFETQSSYDVADRLKTETRAPGTLDLTTTYGYDADGNRTKIEAPGAKASPGGDVEPRVTELTYDGRNTPWREDVGTGSDRRTTLRTLDANGNLRRIVNAEGVGDTGATDDGTLTSTNVRNATRHARLHVYDADDLLTFVYLPWGDQVPNVSSAAMAPERVDDKRYVQRFDRDARGRVTSIFAPYEIGASAAPQTTYSYFATDWISGMSDEEMRRPTPPNPPVPGHLVTYDYDKRGNQTEWRTRNAGTSRGRVVTREFWPNGLLRRRTGRKVNDDGSDDQTTTRTYRHGYNPNRSLVWMKDDRKAGDSDDQVTTFGRDGAERESIVNETWATGKDTRLTYDDNGNVLTRQTDGRWSGTAYEDSDAGRNDAKTTTFAYDSVDRETSMLVDHGDDPDRSTTKTYHPSGELATSTRDLASDIVEERYFNEFGDPTAMRRKSTGAGDWNLKDQTYDYDANGNRTKDERGTHEFNARDQLVKWTRGAKQHRPGTVVTYELTGSGAMAKKLDRGDNAIRQMTTNTFDGTRLLKSETNETESTYSYDDLGSVVRIRTASKVGGTVPAPTPELPALPAQCTPLATVENEVRYCYDEFERMLVAKGSGLNPLDVGVYEYDGFDRRDRKTVRRPTGDESRDLSYIGSSRLLSRERDSSGNTKYYDYDSDGVRVGLARAPASTPDPSRFHSYGHDANGSVEELQEPDGTVGAMSRYVYDPYGALDTRGTLIVEDLDQRLSEDARENPFRFQGFYYDSGVKDYDMHARHYRPDSGRFTTQDRFESARGDFNLQADPLTQNRYVFGGANPVNNIEFDGHEPIGSFNPRGQQRLNDSNGRCMRDCVRPRGSVRPPRTLPSTSSSYSTHARKPSLARVIGPTVWSVSVGTTGRRGQARIAVLDRENQTPPTCSACSDQRPHDRGGRPIQLDSDAVRWDQGFGALKAVLIGDPLHNPFDAVALLPTPLKLLRARALARLGATAAAPAKRATGVTVLGNHPDYVKMSDRTGARRFEVPSLAWRRMSPDEQWAANQRFLDRTITRGDEIRLATPVTRVRPGSFYERELRYLGSKGYTPNRRGNRLIPPGG